jgi:hypothetical protein
MDQAYSGAAPNNLAADHSPRRSPPRQDMQIPEEIIHACSSDDLVSSAKPTGVRTRSRQVSEMWSLNAPRLCAKFAAQPLNLLWVTP